jgi:hypothetical protein
LINSGGDLVRTYQLIDNEKYYNDAQIHPPPLATSKNYIGTPVPDNRNPIFIVNDSLFIRCYPWLDPMKNEYFEIGKLKMGINLNTNNIFYFMSYPDFIWNQNKTYPVQFYNESCTYNNIQNRFIFSFPADHYVYEVSSNGKTIKKHWAGSAYFEKTEALPKNTTDNIKHAEHTFNNFHFERICFDKYRNVYYRLVWHPDAGTRFSFSKPRQAFRPRLSIVILDKDFNQIGETLLPKTVTNTFLFLDHEGLYIQSEVDDVSQISFTLFRLMTI